jgi:flagellin
VAGASKALTVIDSALEYVNAERSKLGAVENRLEHTINNLTNIVTNTQASRSRIMDTDYAAETTELARSQIIQQAATAMLAQANQQPQSVLSLLQ